MTFIVAEPQEVVFTANVCDLYSYNSSTGPSLLLTGFYLYLNDVTDNYCMTSYI